MKGIEDLQNGNLTSFEVNEFFEKYETRFKDA